MQLSWLEQLVKEGHVSQKARAAIYRDCSTLLKTSSIVGKTHAEYVEMGTKVMNTIAPYLPMAVGGLITGATASVLGRRHAAKSLATSQSEVNKTRSILLQNPEFSEHREKAEARFNELVKIAPTVARNPELALRILKDKLTSGFSSQDVQNLALIQAAYTPDMTRQLKLTETTKKASAERAGESLATVVCMCKEAGINLKTLGRAATNALVMTTIPLLGGVGVGAVKHLASKNDKKKLNERLNSSFEEALKLSDPDKDGLHENKELARQAFQVLAHFSPHVALEPNAAKGFMKKLVAWSGQGPQVEDIKSLTEIERNVRQSSGGSPFFEGLASGSKALGLDSALKSSTNSLSRPLDAEVEAMAASDLGLPHGWRKGVDAN